MLLEDGVAVRGLEIGTGGVTAGGRCIVSLLLVSGGSKVAPVALSS